MYLEDDMREFLTLNSLLILVLGGIAGWTVGYVIERFVLGYLSKLGQLKTWQLNTILTAAWQGVLSWIGLATGVYFAAKYIELLAESKVFLGSMLTVVLVLLFTWGIARMIAGLVSHWMVKAKGGAQASSTIKVTTHIVVFTVGILVALQTVGVAITPIITALGVGGLAVALAIRPVLEDIFAGLQLLFSNTIKPGDFIEISEEYKGRVIDISWRTTTLDSFGNNQKIIPNSKLVKSTVINYDRPDKPCSVRLTLTIAYSSDLDKVERVVISEATKVIQQNEVAYQDFEPLVRFKNFADYGIEMQVIVKAKEYSDQYLLSHELYKALHKRLKKEKIKIPYPITEVQLKKT